MKDLRLFSKEFMNKKIRPRRMKDTGQGHFIDISREYTIDGVYQYYVQAYTITENGYKLRECFNIGDLITMGLLKCSGQRMMYQHQIIGGRSW